MNPENFLKYFQIIHIFESNVRITESILNNAKTMSHLSTSCQLIAASPFITLTLVNCMKQASIFKSTNFFRNFTWDWFWYKSERTISKLSVRKINYSKVVAFWKREILFFCPFNLYVGFKTKPNLKCKVNLMFVA